MDFTTPHYYYLFLPIVLIGCFFIFNKSRNYKILFLTLSSYLFFFLASGWYLLLLLLSTLIDFNAAKNIHKSKNPYFRKKILYFSLSLNLHLE